MKVAARVLRRLERFERVRRQWMRGEDPRQDRPRPLVIHRRLVLPKNPESEPEGR